MTKEQYLEKRKEMINKAEGLLNSGSVDDAKELMNEVEALDNQWSEICKEMANVAALKDRSTITNIATKSVNNVIGTIVDKVSNNIDLLNKDELYVNACKKIINQGILDDQEKAAVNLVNEQYENAFANYLITGGKSYGEFKDVFDLVNGQLKNAANIQTAADNAIVVPETMRNQIWQEIGESHPIIGDLSMTFIAGDLSIPKESISGNDADWYDEKTEVVEDGVGTAQISLTGCELAKDITVSWKLKKMSIPAFLAYVTNKIAEKMGNALANAIVNGKGKPGQSDTFKPQPKGIITALSAESNTPQIKTYTVANGVTYKNITELMALIKSGYLSGACVYAKNDFIWTVLANIMVDGKPVFVADATSGGVGRLFGLVVKEEDAIPADSMLIGNVNRGYVANANENITMYFEDHVKARTTDYMGYAIIDGDVMTTKAFAFIKKA